ncbi:MAG: multidrug transporter AcrB [Steroidobacteraceae bacterium]|jgi:HME family heavy-metal exporter
MFNFLLTQSVRNRIFVLIAAALCVAYGLVTLRQLPVDVFPDLNRPTVTIMTEAPGLAPAEVEQLVTYPIETAITGLPGLARVRTVSGVGLSVTYVEFDWGVDIYRARQQVNERLAIAAPDLPPGTVPHMAPISSIMGEILLIALSSEKASPMEVREVAEFVLRPQILNVPGVSQVIPIGGEIRQFRIAPDTVALANVGLTVEDISMAVENFGRNAGGGFLDWHGREYLLRNIAQSTRLEDLKSVVVDVRDGRPITLDQVASVDFAAAPRRGDAGFMGRPAVILSVQKQPGADTVALTEQIEGVLARATESLPEGIKADQLLFRQADFIETSVSNVTRVLFEAMIIVALVIFAFLLNWRSTAISLTAIPLSILVSIIVFKMLGLSINTMTLGGLAVAIGELVDDAVVDVENILRRLRQNAAAGHPRSTFDVVVGASREVRSGILSASLIVVLVFVPLFALTGIEGRLFAPLGIAYIVSILASLLVSITVTPVLSYYLLPAIATNEHGDGALVKRLKRLYTQVLERTLGDHLRPIALACAIAVVLAMVGMLTLPRAFLPPFNEGTYAISVQLDPGVSLEESSRVAQVAEKLILGVPEVVKVGRRTGRAELDEHAEGVHSTEIDVDIRPSDRSKLEVTGDLRARLSQLPVVVNIGQPISHRLDHMLSGVRSEIALKIYGDDLDTLRRTAGEIKDQLDLVPGLVDVQLEKQVRIPQLEVRIDHARAAAYGISPPRLMAALEQSSNGQHVSQVIDGARRYDVVVRLSDDRRSPEALRSMLIDSPGGSIALGQVADIRIADGPNQISRENGRRRIVVYANTDGQNPSGAVAGVRGVLAEFKLPPGYSTRLEGQFLAQESASKLIAGLALISLCLIFAVLYTRYRSTVLALIVMVNVPLAIVGGVIALWLASQPLSVASLVGFVTLAGIATRNGILKISHYINLSLHEGMSFGRDLVIRGSLERLTPVLMTALSAGLALIPLIIAAGAPGKEILHPVAITIFGGLVTSTLLDAIVTPALYLKFGNPSLERLRRAQSDGQGDLVY